MSAGTIITIVIVLVILAVVAAFASTRLRRKTTERNMYGPEYDRLSDEVGPRKAQAEFDKRRQRVDGLGIKSLDDERRSAYTTQWDAAQEQFVDSPGVATRAAGSLVTAVAADRGYDVADRDQFLKDLSVYHGRHLDGYRRADQLTELADSATTENLRQALLDYRTLFFDLLESSEETGVDPEQVPTQAPWRQVTQGRHWKSRRQEEDSDVGATLR